MHPTSDYFFVVDMSQPVTVCTEMNYCVERLPNGFVTVCGTFSGLLTHMEHMRMDPKHQFAAQYVLSRAAAERRERETLLAAVSASTSSSGLLALTGMGGGGKF